MRTALPITSSQTHVTSNPSSNVQAVFSSDPGSFKDAYQDLTQGFARRRLWTQFAVRDVRGRFSGATLGSLWFIIMHSLIVLGLAVMYSKILGAELITYLPYVAVGLTVWNILSGIITDGSGVFKANGIYLKQVKLPYTFFIYRINLKHLLIGCFQAVVVIAMYAFLRLFPGSIMLLAIPGFILMLIFAFASSLFVGVVASRFRDFYGFVQSGLRFAFFLTPIFWDARRLGEYAWMMNFNPFYHFLEIVRAPLLGQMPSMLNYYASAVMTVFMIILAAFAFRYSIKKITYWI